MKYAVELRPSTQRSFVAPAVDGVAVAVDGDRVFVMGASSQCRLVGADLEL
jgi:hypothetical protein